MLINRLKWQQFFLYFFILLKNQLKIYICMYIRVKFEKSQKILLMK